MKLFYTIRARIKFCSWMQITHKGKKLLSLSKTGKYFQRQTLTDFYLECRFFMTQIYESRGKSCNFDCIGGTSVNIAIRIL